MASRSPAITDNAPRLEKLKLVYCGIGQLNSNPDATEQINRECELANVAHSQCSIDVDLVPLAGRIEDADLLPVGGILLNVGSLIGGIVPDLVSTSAVLIVLENDTV